MSTMATHTIACVVDLPGVEHLCPLSLAVFFTAPCSVTRCLCGMRSMHPNQSGPANIRASTTGCRRDFSTCSRTLQSGTRCCCAGPSDGTLGEGQTMQASRLLQAQLLLPMSRCSSDDFDGCCNTQQQGGSLRYSCRRCSYVCRWFSALRRSTSQL